MFVGLSVVVLYGCVMTPALHGPPAGGAGADRDQLMCADASKCGVDKHHVAKRLVRDMRVD